MSILTKRTSNRKKNHVLFFALSFDLYLFIYCFFFFFVIFNRSKIFFNWRQLPYRSFSSFYSLNFSFSSYFLSFLFECCLILGMVDVWITSFHVLWLSSSSKLSFHFSSLRCCFNSFIHLYNFVFYFSFC